MQESATELRRAAESLLSMLERERDSFHPVRGQFSGIRLVNDSHIYHLCADLGKLDLIQCDPASGKWLDRIDVRSWDVIHTANQNPQIGDIQICRQHMDLEPFVGELRNLVQFLKDVAGKMITIERVEQLR
jgi:hypothetical protein